MTDHPAPATAPGFAGLPLPPRPENPAPPRRTWSVRRRAAAAIAFLALAGSGGAVAIAGLAGSDDEPGIEQGVGQGVDGVAPPADPARPGTTSSDREQGETGDGETDSDEADEA